MSTRSADKNTELLEKKYKSSPNSRIFSRLADAYRKEGNINKAIELCLSGIQNHPDYSTGHLILGRCYYEQENYNGALDEFKKVCIIDRHNQIAIKMLADIFVQQGMGKNAGSLYAILMQIDPLNQSIKKLYDQYYQGESTDIFNILGIEHTIEQIAWEKSNLENQVNDQTFYYNQSSEISDIEEPVQTQVSDNTIAMDSDSIDQQMSILYEENPDSEADFQLPTENQFSNEPENIPIENISDNNITDDNEQITGSDISSRIDELFSEQSSIINNPSDNSPQDLSIIESDSIEYNITDMEQIDPSDQSDLSIVTKSDQNNSLLDSIDTESVNLSTKQSSDITIKDPVSRKDTLSEFEETMQFDKSFLDNAIDFQNQNNDSKPVINNEFFSEISEGQQISLDSSASDAFDPSQIIIDTPAVPNDSINKYQESDELFTSSDDLIIENDAQLFSDFQNQNIIDQELISDSIDSAIDTIIDNSENNNDQLSSFLNDPGQKSNIDQIQEDITLENSIYEEPITSQEESSDLLSGDLIDSKSDGETATNNVDDNSVSELNLQNLIESDPIQAPFITKSTPDTSSKTEPVEKASSSFSEEWHQLPNDNNSVSDDQIKSTESVDEKITDSIENPDSNIDQNEPDIIGIADDSSEMDQLSVEQSDDVLTDMDVLVSDHELNSVSGNDIVEKMDSLFSDDSLSKNDSSENSTGINETEDLIEEINDNSQPAWEPVSDNSSEPNISQSPIENTEISNQPESLLESFPRDLSTNQPSGITETQTENNDSMISGQDIKERLDQFFPSDNLFDSSSIMQQTEENETDSELGDFYTIFGDNAQSNQSVDNLAGLENVELEYPLEKEKSISFYDEWNDACNMQDQDDHETIKEIVEKPFSVDNKNNLDDKNNIIIKDTQTSEQPEESRPYTIPDHVLTPTLADIYFQQGQTDLAIQIYNRLLSRDPDNESLQQKIKQIQNFENSDDSTSNIKQNQVSEQKTEKVKPVRKPKTQVDNRPLAGVRINKKRKPNSGNRTTPI